jgi:hypothetical protein
MRSIKMRRAWIRREALGSALLVGTFGLACTSEISGPGGDSGGPSYTAGTGQVYTMAGTGQWVPASGGTTGTGAGGTSGSTTTPNGGTVGTGATPGTTTGGSGPTGAGGSAAGAPSTGARPMDLDGAPIYTRVMRLTNDQWEHAVTDILALGTAPGLSKDFKTPVAGSTDFTNNELVLDVDGDLWDDYRVGAEAAADLATASDAALAKIYSGTDAAGFITTLGRRAYRRPLTDAEKTKYQSLFTTGSAMTEGTGSTFVKGARLVIRAMLQSPYFLYRPELGATGAALTGYEVASKLSFWLRGTTPNDALLDAASKGTLDTADGLVAQATTMLEEPAAATMMAQFHNELMHFAKFNTIAKVNNPAYKDAMNAEFAQSSALFFERIYKQNLGVKDILTSTVGFIGPNTAALYGMPAPASGFQQQDFGPTRPGFFTQAGYLTLYSLSMDPDSILRGVNINRDILCAALEPPGATLPSVPALKPGQTNRQRITTLTAGCGNGCHDTTINPIGFAFENFDGLGQVRTMDNGNAIDTTGSYAFVEGQKTFTGAADLMQVMAAGSQAHACYAKKIASYALQRDIVQSDLPLLDTLKATSAAGSVKQVMLDLVKNAAFRTRLGGSP